MRQVIVRTGTVHGILDMHWDTALRLGSSSACPGRDMQDIWTADARRGYREGTCREGQGCRYSSALQLRSQKSELLLCFLQALLVQPCSAISSLLSQPCHRPEPCESVPVDSADAWVDQAWTVCCRGADLQAGRPRPFHALPGHRVGCMSAASKKAAAGAVCGPGGELALQRQRIGRVGLLSAP